MNKLTELISKCSNSVTVTVNDHKDVYMTVLDSLLSDKGLPSKDWQVRNNVDLTNELIGEIETCWLVVNQMIELDTIIRIQFYPSNSNGSYTIYHYDLDVAIDECLGILGEL